MTDDSSKKQNKTVNQSGGIWRVWKLEKHQESIHKYVAENYIDAEGRAVIQVRLSPDDLPINPLSIGSQPVLSSNIRDYIEERAAPIPMKYPVLIHFYGISDFKIRSSVKTAYFAYYKFKLQEKKRDERIALGKTIVFSLIGAVTLSLSLNKSMGQMIIQLLSVISAFSMWEAANDFLIERNEKRAEFFHAGQLASAELIFD